MILYIPNEFVDILDTILEWNKGLAPELDEVSDYLIKQIEVEKSKAPFILWLRSHEQTHRKHNTRTKEYVSRRAARKDSRDSTKQAYSEASRGGGTKKRGKKQGS